MNNISIKRLWLYTKKHYWENRAYYILYIFIAIFLTITGLIDRYFEGHIAYEDALQYSDYHVKNKFILTFFLFTLGSIVTFTVISSNAINKKLSSIHEMLLPVTFKEKYLFIITNSLVVAPIIYMVIFMAIAPVASNLYMVDKEKNICAERALFSSSVNLEAEFDSPPKFEVAYKFHLSDLYKEIIGEVSDEKKVVALSLFLACFLMSFSATLWGIVSFRRFGVIFSMLIHLALLGGIVCLISRVQGDYGINYSAVGDVRVAGSALEDFLNKSYNWSVLLLIFPLVYQFVIYKKIAFKEIYN